MQQIEYAIGIDVGGTKIAGGVVHGESGQLVLRQTIATRAERGGETVLADCVDLIDELYRAATEQQLPVSGVGIGLCELVDAAGNITDAYNFDWRDLPVIERCSQRVPARLETDVRAAAQAEARYGAGRDYTHFAYVTVGTGISSTLVLNGRPWVGARGNALVLASAPLTTTCPHCGQSVSTILEEYASGPALVRRYNEQATTQVDSGRALFAAVNAGDEIAADIVRSAGAALGVSVAFLCNVVDPEAVIVGGGLGLAGGLYWESFVDATRRHIYAATTRQLPILPAALGVDAGVIGAAAAVLRE
ncbi:MAG: ROK family protein [Caldilineaceae bacterium]